MQGRSSKFHSKDHLEVVHWNGHKRSLSSPCSNPKVNALTTDSPNTWSFGRRGKRRTLWKERLILIGREWVLPYIQTSFTIYSFSTDRWNWSFLLMCHIVGSATSSLLSWNLLIRWYTNWTKRGRQAGKVSFWDESFFLLLLLWSACDLYGEAATMWQDETDHAWLRSSRGSPCVRSMLCRSNKKYAFLYLYYSSTADFTLRKSRFIKRNIFHCARFFAS